LPLLVVVGVLVVALVVNAVVTARETQPAAADVGAVVELGADDLQVRTAGPRDAPAILLVHCYTCSIHWWAELEPLLAPAHRLIEVDLLGHGGSAKPRDGYEIERQADLIATAVQREGVEDVLAVGQSLGGTIVTALAERHPELVRGLVVMDTGPSHEFGNLPFTARLGWTPVIGPALRRIVPDAVVRDSLARAFHEGYDVPDRFVADVNRMTYSAFVESPAAGRDYSDAEPLDDRLAATGKPLLVVFGAEDRIVDPAAADEYRDVPGSRVVLLPGVGHTPQVERPRRSAQLIRAFDRRTAAAAPPPR
jgi:pimeloyl-ACP methyl ester carboxylesterase